MSERIYRLPCECGGVLEVVQEQAGTDHVCTQCGNTVRVPSLQGLKRLEFVEQAPSVRTVGAKRQWSSRPLWFVAAAAAVVVATVLLLRGGREAPEAQPLAQPADRAAETGATAAAPEPSTDAGAAPDPEHQANRDTTPAPVSPPPAPVTPIDLPSLEYLNAPELDLGAHTNSLEPVGSVLVRLAQMVEQRSGAAPSASVRLADAYRYYLAGERLRLSDRRLAEQRRVRLLAEDLRQRLSEAGVLQSAVEAAQNNVNRIAELAEALRSVASMRELAAQNLRRRIGQQRDELHEQLESDVSEQQQDRFKQRDRRLAELEGLADDALAEQYAQWIFLEGWVEQSADRLRNQHKDLSARFGVSREEGEQLASRNEAGFREWVQQRRPAMIRQDLETVATMHGQLLAGKLDSEGQQRLRDLCVRWQLAPTEAPELLAQEDAALLDQLDRRAVGRMRRDLMMWIRMQSSPQARDAGAPSLAAMAKQFELPAEPDGLQAFLESPRAAQLAHHRRVVEINWRQALERMIELEQTIADSQRLQTAAREDAGRRFREFLQNNVAAAETLAGRDGVSTELRSAIGQEATALKQLLEHRDAELLDHCVEVVRLRQLPGTVAEVLDELQALTNLLGCTVDEAPKLLHAKQEQRLAQAARAALVGLIRYELGLLAAEGGSGSGAGDGTGGGRQGEMDDELFEKYQVHPSDAGRLLEGTDEQLWSWHVGRLGAMRNLPDQELVARAEKVLGGLPAEDAPPTVEAGQQERAYIEQEQAAVATKMDERVEGNPLVAPLLIASNAEIAGEEKTLRGQLQPFLQPLSGRYLTKTIFDQQLRTELEAAGDVAHLFAGQPAVPAWVRLLRNGLLHARLAPATASRPTQLYLFLPVEASELAGDDAGQRAYRRWYGVSRLLVRWSLDRHRSAAQAEENAARASAAPSIRVRSFAYFNEFETCTLWVNPSDWETTLESAPPPAGKRPLDLAGWRAFLAESRLEGLQIEDAETEPYLAMYGRPLAGNEPQAGGAAAAPEDPAAAVRPFTLLRRNVELQDLAVAYRAVFYGGDREPFQSLDDARHPAAANANFGGELEDTAMGKVLLDADLTFKFLSSGLDPFAPETVDQREAFQNILTAKKLAPFAPAYDLFANAADQDNGLIQVTRFWLSLQGQAGAGQQFDWRISPLAVEVVNPFFVAEARKQVGGGKELPVKDLQPWMRQAIDHFNRHRAAYEQMYPVLAEVRSVGTLLALCRWMKIHEVGATFDLDELLDEPVDVVTTPRTRQRGVFASVVNDEGTVYSFNCSEIARQGEERPLELASAKSFSELAYMTAGALALSRQWAPDNAAVGGAFDKIYARGVAAISRLDDLTEEEAIATVAELRSALYNVPQQRWMVGCAWTTTGGIDLRLPPAGRLRPDLNGRRSSRYFQRSTKRAPSRRPSKPTAVTPRRQSTKDANNANKRSTAKGSTSERVEQQTKSAPKLERRGQRARLLRGTRSRYSTDF